MQEMLSTGIFIIRSESSLKYSASILISIFFFSCSGPYLKNRARDLGDILTLEAETRSYGVSVRIGPVQAGLSYKSPAGKAVGLRGGHAGMHNTAQFTALFFGADYFTAEPMKDIDGSEKDQPLNTANQKKLPVGTEEFKKSGTEAVENETIGILKNRNKSYRARSPFGTLVPLYKKKHTLKTKGKFAPASYFTQIDVSLGAYLGIRIGINPGELLDFLLGWFKIDIYSDDEPFVDSRIKKLKENPLWNSLDPATKKRLEQEMNDPEKRKLLEGM